MGVSFVQDTLPDAIEEGKDEFDPLLGLENFPWRLYEVEQSIEKDVRN